MKKFHSGRFLERQENEMYRTGTVNKGVCYWDAVSVFSFVPLHGVYVLVAYTENSVANDGQTKTTGLRD